MNRSPTNWQAARRFQAWQHQQQGWSQRQIAEALGVSEAAVSQWMRRARDGGPAALRHQPPSGAPRRLAADQLARLPELLHRGAEADGCRGPMWTCGRIAAVMRLACGVSSPPVPGGRVLNTLRWSPQQPARRARQRDETALARWREETWPARNRGPKPRSRRFSASMHPGSLPGPGWSARLPREAKRPGCRSGGPATSWPRSAPSRPSARAPATARTVLSTLTMWSRVSSSGGGRCPARS
jgi:transposase